MHLFPTLFFKIIPLETTVSRAEAQTATFT